METVEHNQTRVSQVAAVSIRQFILRFGVYISLAILLIAALFVTPELYSPQSLFLVLRQTAQLGLVAIGQTLVLLVAGLDLSVGAGIVLTNVVIAEVSAGDILAKHHPPTVHDAQGRAVNDNPAARIRRP